jgi:hypothetical protein
MERQGSRAAARSMQPGSDTPHSHSLRATARAETGKRRDSTPCIESYTSAFASWSTGRGVLQQKENTVVTDIHREGARLPYPHTSIYNYKQSHCWDRLEVHIFSVKTLE